MKQEHPFDFIFRHYHLDRYQPFRVADIVLQRRDGLQIRITTWRKYNWDFMSLRYDFKTYPMAVRIRTSSIGLLAIAYGEKEASANTWTGLANAYKAILPEDEQSYYQPVEAILNWFAGNGDSYRLVGYIFLDPDEAGI